MEPPPRLFPANPRFTFLELLGQGGLGVVFLAFDRLRQQKVALKRVTAFGPDAAFQTRGEFRVLADVHHPNIARVLDLFVDEFGTYFTLEHVDGGTFDAWIRGEFGPPLSPTDRLLQGARALFRAIAFLHSEGLAHGDVKPSNLLVNRDGVLKLVDFGLVREVDGLVRRVNPNAGTPLYLPQEAFFGNTDVKNWDWYAAGLTLFEVTLGRVPFPEPYDDYLGLAVLKSERLDPTRFPRPREVPGWFVNLLFGLLEPEASQRPAPATLLQAVGEPPRQATAFVGRRKELGLLSAYLQAVRDQGACVVEVTGPSGIGKTSLVQQCLRGERDRALVLPARCRQNERVPFNALDAAVDALSRAMMELGPGLSEAMLPRDAAELLALFPVLRVVPPLALAASERPLDPRMSPPEQRQRGAAALRLLLEALSRRRPVVLWIDDAQWADRDSLWLLGELLRPPRVPALLLLLCVRDDALADYARGAQDLRAVPLPWYHLAVEPLGMDDATALAHALLGSDQRTARDVAHNGGGNPFFIQWLSRLSPGVAPPPMGEAVARHVEGLAADERRFLGLCAVAAGALPVEALLDAGALATGGHSVLDGLVLGRLLRMRRATGAQAAPGEHLVVDVTHAQVEAGVLATLTESRLAALHSALADALRRLGGSPDRVVRHLVGAGRPQEAAGEALEAAQRAEAGLAFDAAAAFYRQAAELGAEAPVWVLLEAEARCLVYAGELSAAGEAFEQAAAEVEATDALQALDLGRRAAEQYLHCGQVARGRALFEAVLAALGVPAIHSKNSGKYSKSLRLRLGLGSYREHAGRTVEGQQRVRLDALWGATTSLALVNHQLADAYGVMHLAEALRVQDAERRVRALGYEAAFLFSVEHWLLPATRGEKLMRRVLAMAADQATPYSLAWARMSAAAGAWHRAQWRRCVEECDRAEAIYAAECQGVDWERAVNAVHRLYALAQLGELEQLAREVPDGLRHALARGDQFAANHHRQGPVCLLWLAGDAPANARMHLEAAERTWQDDLNQLFSTHHYHHLIAATQVDLYEGHHQRAFARMEAAWPRIEAAGFAVLGYCGAELDHLRGRAALAWMSTATEPGAQRAAEAVVRIAIRRLKRRKSPVAQPFYAVLEAGLLARAQQRAEARARMREAVVRFEELGMALHVGCSRLWLARLRADGGATGETDAAALAPMSAQGIARPERFAAVLMPGI